MMVLGQNRSVLIDNWWYRVSMERYWLTYDGTGSVEGGTDGTWWYWVRRRRYWLIHDILGQ